jgi:hypothetical protein
MLCPNNVLRFQNFPFITISASLTVTHMFKYELGSTSTRTPYDRWEVVFKRYKIINV